MTDWRIPLAGGESALTWSYTDGRERLLALYEKGKKRQWNATDRLDWSARVDHANPLGFPEEYVPIFGSREWERLDAKARAELRLNIDSWRFSQFLHGEQGALVCAAKIVQTVPDLDSKLYAATQAIDEARHVEVYARYLHEKLGLVYPINPHLKTLLEQAIGDARWDFTYLAMQVIIEGLALAAFGLIRDFATEPLGKALTAYVMEDEARHVAFGRLALRDYYPELTQKERDDREQFAVEACYLMRDRFRGEEVWERMNLDVKECVRFVEESALQREFTKMLFSRIVPTLKDIGLFGPRIQKAFADMQVMDFAEVDVEALGRADEDVASELEKLRAARGKYVEGVAADGA
jgi:hypothetical protein